MMVLTPYIAVCFAKFFKPIVVQAKPDKSKFKIQNSKFTAAIKRGQSQACLNYAEREQTREDL